MRKNVSTKSHSDKDYSRTSHEPSMLRYLFIDLLKDIYWGEKHLVKFLPKLEKAVTSDDLKQTINSHLSETEGQLYRLEEVFEQLGERVVGKKCEAIAGLTDEAQSIIKETEAGTLTRDAALIIAAQKIEHYEIATYGGLVQLAHTLGEPRIASILEETLNEEKNADKTLSELATQHINEDALAEHL